MNSIHHVNHPGKELNISFRSRNIKKDFYVFENNSTTEGIRFWNYNKYKEKSYPHKRKFIEHPGTFVKGINELEQSETVNLRFWGEYEGRSKFKLLEKQGSKFNHNNPTAVHKPFFSNEGICQQNTDPYIFGDEFFYAICKKGNLTDLKAGDIVLFGSEFGSKANGVKFYLDTLMVIKDVITRQSFEQLDEVYMESTIRRLDDYYDDSKVFTVHRGLKFSDPNRKQDDVFSFVPCKQSDNSAFGFGRPVIDTETYYGYLKKPGAYTGCKSCKLNTNHSIKHIWEKLAEDVLKQGFLLGTHFESVR